MKHFPKHALAWSLLRPLSLCIALSHCSLHAADPVVVTVLKGSSPCGDEIRALLDIPVTANADIIEWSLSLRKDSEATTYELQCEYGPSVSGIPGLGNTRTKLKRSGRWTSSIDTRPSYEIMTHKLVGAVSLRQISPDIWHVLNREGNLMLGSAGWSYTLNKSGDWAKANSLSYDDGRRVSAVSTGPAVFGVFEGRTPCSEIARVLQKDVKAGCWKIKWRVTLYRDPETGTPTTYKVESTIHSRTAREGRWTVIPGTAATSGARVFRLESTEDEAELLLLEADKDVLFLLDEAGTPLMGNANFSYTLNRRAI